MSSCRRRIRVLFCAPISMIDGQSKVSKIVYEFLQSDHEVDVRLIDSSNSRGRLSRFWGNCKVIAKLLLSRLNTTWGSRDVVYFTPSRSLLGSVKDLVVLLLYGALSRSFIVGHLHGADLCAFLSRSYYGYLLRHLYFRCLDCMILLSEKQKPYALGSGFSGYVTICNPNPHRAGGACTGNFGAVHRELNMLFVSVPINSKGLDDSIRFAEDFAVKAKYKVNFRVAGWTELDYKEQYARQPSLKSLGCFNSEFLGPLNKSEINALMAESQIFVFLSRYPSEAQPLSVIEALMSGCVVVLSRHNFLEDFSLFSSVVYSDEPDVINRVEVLVSSAEIRAESAALACQVFSVDTFKKKIAQVFHSV